MQETSMIQLTSSYCLYYRVLLSSSSWLYSAMKMKATCSSETLVYSQLTTRRYILYGRTIHNHRSGILSSYTDQDNLSPSDDASPEHKRVGQSLDCDIQSSFLQSTERCRFTEWNSSHLVNALRRIT
jgi:hypothetical protein